MLFLLMSSLPHHGKSVVFLQFHGPADHCNSRSAASAQGTAESQKDGRQVQITNAFSVCPRDNSCQRVGKGLAQHPLHISSTPVRHTHLLLLAGARDAARGNSSQSKWQSQHNSQPHSEHNYYIEIYIRIEMAPKLWRDH